MSRRYQCFSTKECYCCCPRNKNDFNRFENMLESCEEEEDDYMGYAYTESSQTKVNYKAQELGPMVDEETWRDLSILRRKACDFIKSESEYTSTSDSAWRPHSYPRETWDTGTNLVRKASDQIDYEPESTFLKRIKKRCQFWDSDQQTSTGFPSYEGPDRNSFKTQSQKCTQKAGQLQQPLERISGGVFRCAVEERPRVPQIKEPRTNKNCYCLCPREPPKNNDYCNQDVVNEYSSIFDQYQNADECPPMDDDFGDNCDMEVQKPSKKYEHLSRSKTKTRGRKKEVAELKEQDASEHSLKKPHENSCERCWRYASPSRSPVNKPEQRYDPNFRKAHSCTNFEAEKCDGDLEVVGKHISPCKNLQPVFNKNFVPLKTSQPEKKQSSTKVKELEFSNSQRREPDINTQRVRPFGEYNRCEPPASQALIYSDSGRKQRPKSHNPATSRGFYDFPNFIDDLDITEYKETHIRPRKKIFEPGDPCNKYTRSTESRMPNSREIPCISNKNFESLDPKALRSTESRTPNCRENVYSSKQITQPVDPCNRCLRSAENRIPNSRDNICNSKQNFECVDAYNRSVRNTENRIPCGSSRTEKMKPQIVFNEDFKSAKENECYNGSGKSSRNGRRIESDKKSPTYSGNRWNSTNYDDMLVPAKNVKSSSAKKSEAASPSKTESLGKKSGSQKKSGSGSGKKSGSGCPKKSGSGSRKRSKSPKGGKKSGSPKHSRRELSSEKSPRKPMSERSPPKRTKSMLGLNEICPQYRRDKPDTPCVDMQANNADRGYVDSPLITYAGSPHPIIECDCYPRIPRYKHGDDFYQNITRDGHVVCCHCKWKERKQQNAGSREPGPSQRNNLTCEGQPQTELNRAGNNRNVPPQKTRRRSPIEIAVRCPYVEYDKKRTPLRTENLSETVRQLRTCENYPAAEQRNPPKCPNPCGSNYSPKKYCVFYMTKNKEDKGDDVEVLVEELTQTDSHRKDSKTRDLAEKMKRILECQSDSMALRFQKGMTDSSKHLQNSRILYF